MRARRYCLMIFLFIGQEVCRAITLPPQPCMQEDSSTGSVCLISAPWGAIQELSVPAHAQKSFETDGCTFDPVWFTGISDSLVHDITIFPDATTVRYISKDGKRSALYMAHMHTGNTVYAGDPRFILKKAIEALWRRGYNCYMTVDIEYRDRSEQKMSPSSLQQLLADCAIPVVCVTTGHEYGHYLVRLSPMAPMDCADTLVRLRWRLEQERLSTEARFELLKSTMRFCVRDLCESTNVLYDTTEECGLSSYGRAMIARLMQVAAESSLLWRGSFDLYGSEEQLCIAWGIRNRSGGISVSFPQEITPEDPWLEINYIDIRMNIHLALAAVIRSFVEGLQYHQAPSDPINDNVKRLRADDYRRYSVVPMPDTFEQVLTLARESDFLLALLGSYTASHIEIMRTRWIDFRRKGK